MERLFRALADRTRLRLLSLMAEGEVCVCFFVEVLEQSQPKISRHLAYLRNAGVVEARRDGKWMHYRVVEPADEHAARIFNEVRAWLVEDQQMKRDRQRLEKVCCGVKVPVTLQRAPLPAGLQTRREEALATEEPDEPAAEPQPYQPGRRRPAPDANWLDYD